jgi:hypothetical protein
LSIILVYKIDIIPLNITAEKYEKILNKSKYGLVEQPESFKKGFYFNRYLKEQGVDKKSTPNP